MNFLKQKVLGFTEKNEYSFGDISKKTIMKTMETFSRKELKVSVSELSSSATLSGKMTKMGKRVKNWKSRYFVLKDSTLYYFESENSTEASGLIHLNGCKLRQVDFEELQQNFCFEIETSDRRWFLVCQTDLELREWIKQIESAARPIQRSPSLPQLQGGAFEVNGVCCPHCKQDLWRILKQNNIPKETVIWDEETDKLLINSPIQDKSKLIQDFLSVGFLAETIHQDFSN